MLFISLFTDSNVMTPQLEAEARPRHRQRRATEGSSGDQHLLELEHSSRQGGRIDSQHCDSVRLADELAELCTFKTAGSGRSICIMDPSSLEQERLLFAQMHLWLCPFMVC